MNEMYHSCNLILRSGIHLIIPNNMMRKVVLLLVVIALAAAETYIAEDQDGFEYLLLPIPLSRHRRQTTIDITKNPSGTTVDLGHKGTIFQNENHRVTGEGFVSKQFDPNGPATVGGNVGYQHLPSGSTLNLGASNTRGFGTDLSARGTATIYQNDNHKLTGNAFVSKHLRPTGPTTIGGGVGYEHLPSGSTLNVGASNTRGFGTDFSAKGTANIWSKENSKFDAFAQYDRHYGGPWGTGKPNYAAGIQFTHNF